MKNLKTSSSLRNSDILFTETFFIYYVTVLWMCYYPLHSLVDLKSTATFWFGAVFATRSIHGESWKLSSQLKDMELHAGIIEMNYFYCKINISEKCKIQNIQKWKCGNIEASLFGIKCNQVSISGFVILKYIETQCSECPTHLNISIHCTAVLKILMFMIWKVNCTFNVPARVIFFKNIWYMFQWNCSPWLVTNESFDV